MLFNESTPGMTWLSAITSTGHMPKFTGLMPPTATTCKEPSARTHDEQLDDGTEIDVQVRISRTGGVQMFLGVYRQEGKVLAEEVYENLPGQTVARALV
jgi:hypothetical protein